MMGIHIFPLSMVGTSFSFSFSFSIKEIGCAMHGHSQEGTKQKFVSKPF
jgi:hypothetical protein